MVRSLFVARAIGVGAATCLAIAAPAAVIQANLANHPGLDQSNWVYVTLLAILVAYLVGGAVAGSIALDSPMINGATATLITFGIVQLVAAVIRVVAGDGINLLALPFNALLAAAIGTVGGGIGAQVSRRISWRASRRD